MVYYDKNEIIVRDSIENDVRGMAGSMRSSDKEEVWFSHHYTPEQAISHAFKESVLCFTVELKGKVIAMFGAVPDSLLSNSASVWLLATDDLTKIQRQFIRQSREFIKHMLSFYPRLYNFCYSKNIRTIKWLKFCGSVFYNSAPYGIEGKMFNFFTFERG